MRRNERAYSEVGLDDASLEDAALIQAMVDHPILIERPTVFPGRRAVLG